LSIAVSQIHSIWPRVPVETSILYVVPQGSVTYILPSLTSGVVSIAPAPKADGSVPPSGTAKASFRPEAFSGVISSSGE
jgi:hypothetical protein